MCDSSDSNINPTMATEILPTPTNNKIQQFFDDLESQSSLISTCTQLYTTLSNHFSSLEASISQKSQSIDSNYESLQTHLAKTLESLKNRENSISQRESDLSVRVEQQKEEALAEFSNPISENAKLSETLKSLCRKMDYSALYKFVIYKRKESASLKSYIGEAILEAVDPPRLVLDAVEEFLSCKLAKYGVTDKRWACGFMIKALFPVDSCEGKSSDFCRRTIARAVDLVEMWKKEMDGGFENGEIGGAEAVMFLQMVVGFGLRKRFDEEYLIKLIVEYGTRRDMAKIACALNLGDKIGGLCNATSFLCILDFLKYLDGIFVRFTHKFGNIDLICGLISCWTVCLF